MSSALPGPQVGAVILAAGGSRRLKRPKQLEPWQGRPLAQHIAATVLASQVVACAIVLGHQSAAVHRALGPMAEELAVLENPQWQQGQSSSVRVGLAWAEERLPDLQGVIFVPVDQPFLTPGLFNRSIAAHHQAPQRLIVPHYPTNDGSHRPGAPVLWPRGLWHHLRKIRGDAGGRRLIQDLPHESLEIDDPRQGMDLDTEDDLALLRGLIDPLS